MVEEADMATEVAERTGKSEDTGGAEIEKKDENGADVMYEDVKEDEKSDSKEGEENKEEEHIDAKEEEEKEEHVCLKEEEENKAGEENDSEKEENKMEIDNDSKKVEENKVEIASDSKEAEVNKVEKNKDKKEEEENEVEENKDTKPEEENKVIDNKDSKKEVGNQDSKEEVENKDLKEEKENKDSKEEEENNDLMEEEEKKGLKEEDENGIAEHIDSKEEEESEKEEPHYSKDNEEDEETTNEEKSSEAQVSGEGNRPKNRSYKGGAKEEAKEPTSPVASHLDRPVRERKSVERLVASIEKEPAREFLIPKGRGTALKDIPNVANKLSRKKNDEILKMLHVILFGRRGKATHVRSNLSQFSGFVWHENEEKQRLKIKEKLDKLVKEKLLEFCDVFDIPVLKATAKKEDIVTRLLDFLAAPKPASNVLVAEKEESGTTKKRSKIVKRSTPESGGSDAKHLSKKKRKIEGTSKMAENGSDSGHEFDKSETDGEFDKEEDEERARSFSDGSEDEVAEHSQRKEKQSESKEESEEETRNQNLSLKKASATPTSGKNKPKKVANAKKENPALSPKRYSTKKRSRDQVEKNEDEGIGRSGPDESEDEAAEHSISKENGSDSSEESEEETRKGNSVSKRPSAKMISPVEAKPKKKNSTTNETPVRSPTKSPSTKRFKVNDSSSKSIEVFSRKKKSQETDKAKPPAPLKSTKEDVKEQSGKKSSKGKDERTKEKSAPTEAEIRTVICQILAEVDLSKATFLDILKQLGERFKVDLEPRKAEIKLMVKEELTKLNDEEDEEDDESETEGEETPKPEVGKTKLASADRGKSVDKDSESRCRRSDGKKWRCSKPVVDGQKYCEHHMHRGRKR